MKTKLLSIILLAFLFISCENDIDKDLTLRLITSSKLTVKVLNNEDLAIANANIKIYDLELLSTSTIEYPFASTAHLYSESTDENGLVNFGEISSGKYLLIIDSVQINGLRYMPIMQFQINSTVDKNITIHPEDYFSTYNFNFQKAVTTKTSSMVSISDFDDLNILFIPFSEYSNLFSLEKLISLAEIKAKTNSTGSLSLKVPSFKNYHAIVFNDAKTIFSSLTNSPDGYVQNLFSGDKGQNFNLSYLLDANTLLKTHYTTYSFSIKKATLNPLSTKPTLSPFAGLNLAAIPRASYDPNMPLEDILEFVELSGKTDSDGNISFSFKTGTNHMILLFNDDKTTYNTLPSSVYAGGSSVLHQNFILDSQSLAPVTYASFSLTINKTDSKYYTPKPTDLSPFSNLKVALLPSTINSTATIDDLLSEVLLSGTTDINGKILFSVPLAFTSSYYKIMVYNEEKTAKFITSNISINSSGIYHSYTLNSTTLEQVN